MDLQSIFYLLAIILMVLMISFLIAIAYFLTKLQQSIESIKTTMNNKVEEIKSNANSEIAGIAGGLVTSFIMSRIKNMFRKKKSHSD